MTSNWALAALVFLAFAAASVLAMMVRLVLRQRWEQAMVRATGGLPIGPATARNLYGRLARPSPGDSRSDCGPPHTTRIALDWEASDEERRESYRSAILELISSRNPVVAAGAAELCWLLGRPITEAKPLVAELCAGWRHGLRGLRLALAGALGARLLTESLERTVVELGIDDERTVQFLEDEELLWALLHLDLERTVALAANMIRRGTPTRGAYSFESQLDGFFAGVAAQHGREALFETAERLAELTGRTDFVTSRAIAGVRAIHVAGRSGWKDPELFRATLRQLEQMRPAERPSDPGAPPAEGGING